MQEKIPGLIHGRTVEPPSERLSERILTHFGDAIGHQLSLIDELHSRLAKVSLEEEPQEKDNTCVSQEVYPEYFHNLRGYIQTIELANARLARLLKNLSL